MKRTLLTRKTSLRRQVPVRRRNAKRAAKRLDAAFGEQAARCRRSMCIACVLHSRVQDGLTEPHHDPSRAAGGLDRDTVPLCRWHHDRCHRLGRETFWAVLMVDVAELLAFMRAGGVVDSAWAQRWRDDNCPVDLQLGVAWR